MHQSLHCIHYITAHFYPVFLISISETSLKAKTLERMSPILLTLLDALQTLYREETEWWTWPSSLAWGLQWKHVLQLVSVFTLSPRISYAVQELLCMAEWTGFGFDLQLKGLIVFGWPCVALRLCALFSLLFSEVGTQDENFHKGTKHCCGLPVQIIDSNHCKNKKGGKQETALKIHTYGNCISQLVCRTNFYVLYDLLGFDYSLIAP